MQITRATDYAVRVMIQLAGLPAGASARQSELSKATEVSGHFLSKVLQQLVRSGLIRSQRGQGGGYALALPARNVSLLDIVAAIEGPVRLNQCLEEGPSCNRKASCPAHAVWIEAQLAIEKVLGEASVAKLAAQTMTESAELYSRHAKPIWISAVHRSGHGKSP